MSNPPVFDEATDLGSRFFSEQDQRAFADATGDHNPMHMDAVVARRTQAGVSIVHGVHALMWLLERVAGQCPDLPAIASVDAKFKKMIDVNTTVEARLTRGDANSLRASILSEGETLMKIIIAFGPPSPVPEVLPFPKSEEPLSGLSQPVEVLWENIANQSGRLAFAPGSAKLADLFPHLTALWGAPRLAALGCTSLLVGMVMPGLHSIYSALVIRLCGSSVDSHLTYNVTSADSRFRLITQTFAGGGLAGSIESYFRRPPTRQADMKSIAQLVAKDAFSGTTVLVVGGSRGIGELTAKIIAAGGGDVIISYAVGKSEAEAVCAQIVAWGGRCHAIAYDVRLDADAQLTQIAESPTHYYYFATPPIGMGKTRWFSEKRFADFNAFYVTGFDNLIKAGLRRRPTGIRAFYPSSIAVENRPPGMTAYAMSKAAGELLCADMNAAMPEVRVIVNRLPRLLTDQTATVAHAKTEDPIKILLPLIREMHS